MTVARYNGLRITVRDDGLIDVLRERETNGETIRAHCTALDWFEAT